MSNNDNLSLRSSGYNNKRDAIDCRIEIIQKLLKGNTITPFIEFDNTETNDDVSRGSYDTRIALKKRVCDFENVIYNIGNELNSVGGRLEYIKSGTTGHTFKGRCEIDNTEYNYGVKVSAFPKKDDYGNVNDIRRPENAEILMLKVLSQFIITRQTPHIVLPIGTFDTNIRTFTDILNYEKKIGDDEKYNEFITKYKAGYFHDNVSILISEWADMGDLLDFIRKNYMKFTPLYWKVFFFQILSVLAVIQSVYPSFRHNDLKANNILVQRTNKQTSGFTYVINDNKYHVPNIGYDIKLWDFDFACIPGLVNNKKVDMRKDDPDRDWTLKINVTPVQNRYYDVHYFFNTLMLQQFCKSILESEYVPSEVIKFIHRVVPKKYRERNTEYVHKKGRILVNNEYLTPEYIIRNDPYFEEFRYKQSGGFNRKQSTLKKNVSEDKKINIKSFLVDSDNKKSGTKQKHKKTRESIKRKTQDKKTKKKSPLAKLVAKRNRTISS